MDALLTASLLVAVSDCPGTRAAGLVLDVDALWAEVDELIAP